MKSAHSLPRQGHRMLTGLDMFQSRIMAVREFNECSRNLRSRLEKVNMFTLHSARGTVQRSKADSTAYYAPSKFRSPAVEEILTPDQLREFAIYKEDQISWHCSIYVNALMAGGPKGLTTLLSLNPKQQTDVEAALYQWSYDSQMKGVFADRREAIRPYLSQHQFEKVTSRWGPVSRQ